MFRNKIIVAAWSPFRSYRWKKTTICALSWILPSESVARQTIMISIFKSHTATKGHAKEVFRREEEENDSDGMCVEGSGTLLPFRCWLQTADPQEKASSLLVKWVMPMRRDRWAACDGNRSDMRQNARSYCVYSVGGMAKKVLPTTQTSEIPMLSPQRPFGVKRMNLDALLSAERQTGKL